MYDGDPDKKEYYLKATEMFYSYYKDYFEQEDIEQFYVPMKM